MVGKLFGKPIGKNTPLLKRYKQLRKLGLKLSEEIPEIYGLEKSLPYIVRVMGLGQMQNIMLESEEEINFLMDFYLHEYQENGQTLIDRYRADHPEADDLVIAYLDAAQASYTSLFKVIAVNPIEKTVTLSDLLNRSDETLTVININFSQTAKPGYVLFSRLLPYADFNAFSGMYAGFPDGGDRALLKRYKVMKKRVKSDRDSVQRFVACFKLNRVLGMESATRQV